MYLSLNLALFLTTPLSIDLVRFQVWSNGRLHNVRHRVRCVAPVPRISIAMFLLGPKDGRVSAPEAFVDADRPRRYKEFNYDDLRRLRQSTGEHAGEALARLEV
jgi:isopenicillin N synthase-like dioxygenase